MNISDEQWEALKLKHGLTVVHADKKTKSNWPTVSGGRTCCMCVTSVFYEPLYTDDGYHTYCRFCACELWGEKEPFSDLIDLIRLAERQ